MTQTKQILSKIKKLTSKKMADKAVKKPTDHA